MDLVMFLRARLDEDEEMAWAASPGPWKPNAEHDEVLAVDDITVAEGFALSSRQQRATVDHIARHDPARVLVEVEAKREVLAIHSPPEPGSSRASAWSWCPNHCQGCGNSGPCDDPVVEHTDDCPTLFALAIAYRDHADFASLLAENRVAN